MNHAVMCGLHFLGIYIMNQQKAKHAMFMILVCYAIYVTGIMPPIYDRLPSNNLISPPQ